MEPTHHRTRNANRNKASWRTLHRTHPFWIIILVIVILIGVIKQQKMINDKENSNKKPIANVVVATAHRQDVPIYITALGNVTPTYSVQVKTQVNGALLRVAFQEGQVVKAGDLLAEIDSRPYEAQLMQYEGQLIRDRALLANATIDLKRYQTLWSQDSVSQQTLATQKALVNQYEGAVKTDEGLIQTAKINIAYCHITSPINGRVGLRLVDPGNIVQTSDTTGIAIINTLDPITVVFTIPEDDVLKVLPHINANPSLTVEAYNREQTKLLASGKLLTIDNQMDPTTGTVKLKAQFANPKQTLFPNQFVNVKLHVATLKQAIVVPTMAIQNSTQGNFVYVVENNQTVRVQSIRVQLIVKETTVIASGLQPGQSVVIEGADKLINGAPVKVANLTSNQQSQRQTNT